ncbi:Protein of unknown function [Microlunatus sagamiharensis]|uniref:DUF3592 domain-containing protein n=1 Tax=Microlunatus sagamiharensis TaxID=546874 RepID=A0A1H2N024_9ACTN|nr:DUF3592 domain-containing protein [Microlunatus sagamiharensis]SDU98704.1 Protein of unknown function [Microlunatus sagamiharensis]
MSFGRGFRLVAVALGGLAVVLTIVCVVDVVRTRAFLAESAVATGQVVELVERQSCRDDDQDEDRDREVCSTIWAPRIVFTAEDGRDVDFVSAVAEAPPAYAEGDLVDVRYDPRRPAQARVDSVMGLWLAAIVTGALAAVFAGMCAIWMVLAVRFRRE